MRSVCGIWCILLCAMGVASATSPPRRDAWLMKNYRFTGPPAPRMVGVADPAVSGLQQVQGRLEAMVRRAILDEDPVTALYALIQMSINAQQIGALSQVPPMQAGPQLPQFVPGISGGPVVYPQPNGGGARWSDGLMQHYITPQGTHVQTRLGAR